MEEIKMTKRFKIKIRFTADSYDDDGKVYVNLSDAVKSWYEKPGGGRESLMSHFANLGNVLDNSYLNNFIFKQDSVDKEAYD